MSRKSNATFSNYRWSANDEAVCYNLIQEKPTIKLQRHLADQSMLRNHVSFEGKTKAEGKPW